MKMTRATEQELEELFLFYRLAADSMEERSIRHWHWGLYPSEDLLRGDVKNGRLYILRTDGGIKAAVSAAPGQEDAYNTLPWTCGTKPGSFQRLAVHPSMQGTGIGSTVLEEVQQLLLDSGCDCIRCDTSENNTPALRFYEKHGFRRCGRLHWEEVPGDNITFDKALRPEAPLLPIRMKPAFRCGWEETPWGGEKLRKRYGKETTDPRTGESLEVSCIPGKESTDLLGRKLPDLIREFGGKMAGRYADKPFPLLLKLIDARDQLSVQVHPDDAYARKHEHGKLGKAEAWLILDAPEGSELVYGLRPGTGLQQLKDACERGRNVEALLRRVRVSPGDVCYIPAGCVHAIGSGIMLYEIQESSDITYRFYDWNRTDRRGNSRRLHLEQALAVADLACAPQAAHVSEAYGTQRLVDQKSFTLDIIRCGGTEPLPEGGEFGILTVLEGGLTLYWDSGEMNMRAGETCFLPKSAPKLCLSGEGCAGLAMPNG